MSEKLSVKELIELLDGLLSYEKVVAQMLADGKVDKSDIPALLSSLPELAVTSYKAVEGLDKLPKELEDLSEAEAAEVVAHVAGKLAIGDEKAKKVVKYSMAILVNTGLIVKTLLEKADAPAA